MSSSGPLVVSQTQRPIWWSPRITTHLQFFFVSTFFHFSQNPKKLLTSTQKEEIDLVKTPSYFLLCSFSSSFFLLVLSSVLLQWDLIMYIPADTFVLIHSLFDQLGVGPTPFWNQPTGMNTWLRVWIVRWKISVLVNPFVLLDPWFNQWMVVYSPFENQQKCRKPW